CDILRNAVGASVLTGRIVSLNNEYYVVAIQLALRKVFGALQLLLVESVSELAAGGVVCSRAAGVSRHDPSPGERHASRELPRQGVEVRVRQDVREERAKSGRAVAGLVKDEEPSAGCRVCCADCRSDRFVGLA